MPVPVPTDGGGDVTWADDDVTIVTNAAPDRIHMSAPRQAGTDRVDTGNGVVRRMARDGRAGAARSDQTPRAGATASADAVEQLRRSVTDIKHDIRMLKVMLDKQSIAIDRLVGAVEDLSGSEEE